MLGLNERIITNMPTAVDDLEALYADTKTCAKLVGLDYVEGETAGYTRRKHGKGFQYLDSSNHQLADKELRTRITELVIPPAWQDVWICPSSKGHILATGIDEKGRKQYIYHPKWRTMRDIIKFYRMIIFAKALPVIRKDIGAKLAGTELTRDKIIAVMLWLLDNTYIRIGNEQYFESNDSIGLTTLTDKNIVIAGSVTTLAFRGKSGKDHQITFDNALIADALGKLRQQAGERLFRYRNDSGDMTPIESNEINDYLHALSGVHISAKDFRTWGGTLMAFNHIVETERSREPAPKPEKVVIQAVDAAANVLGNTRSIAKSSYVHPHILHTYGTKNFQRYYETARQRRTTHGLDKRETELAAFLEQLFKDEFDLLQQKQSPA